MTQLVFGEIKADVFKKDIKNLHLSVYPPTGKVRISAPKRMTLDSIRAFVCSKIGWIKKQQAKLRAQEREAPRDYISRESHYFAGERYLLAVKACSGHPNVVLKHSTIELRVKKNASRKKKETILDEWYRQGLKDLLPKLITMWERKIGVEVVDFGVRKMKTRWGSCNRKVRRIWLNLELAKKPPECLEYVVVHEMAHLIEKGHGEKFIKLMNQYLPKWRFFREELNRFPVSHTSWKY